jgi:multicomponent Na+:H+ antiporter subunit E
MRWFRRIISGLGLALYFVSALVSSGVRVSILALTPRLKLRPAIVAYPLTLPRDSQITLLANLITLTPGTLSLDVSDDRKWLHIHCLDLADAEAKIDEIAGGFETRIMELWQ